MSSISVQGTWADHIIIQAVADALNLRINMIESSENFNEQNVVEPAAGALSNPIREICIGHIGEIHYVSTTARYVQSEETSSQNLMHNQSETIGFYVRKGTEISVTSQTTAIEC